MSRVGKLPIPIPKGVSVAIDGEAITVKGPKGELAISHDPTVSVAETDGTLVVSRQDESRRVRSLHGLTRCLVANMVQGVSDGFTRVLEINGVGYRADVQGSKIHFSLGYSHPIVFQLPDSVQASVEKQTVVSLSGPDRQVLGQCAAMIRALRPPEPYKGKGVKYAEETVRRKAGKATGAG